MTGDVTLGLAFIAGIISFISPCVLPLVPAYVGYMGGRITKTVSLQGSSQASGLTGQRFGTFLHGIFFVLGFTLFFVIFGLLTTAAVSSLTSVGVTEAEVRDGIARIGGTAVILFGLHIMGILNRAFTWLNTRAAALDRSRYANLISIVITLVLLGAVYWLFVESWFMTLVAVLLFVQIFRDAFKSDTPGAFWTSVLSQVQTLLYVDTRRQTQPKNQYGYLGSMFMGVVFSAGWTPCIGPIYGAVLTLASTGGSLSEAGTLLTAYSLGLGIPFLLTALALDQAQGLLRGLQRNMRLIESFSGVFLILIGVMVFSGQLERISSWGNSGALGDISYNLEECAVATVNGQVRVENFLTCIDEGLKEDYYVAYPKPALASNAASSPANANPDSDLDVPDLGVPDLGAASSSAAPSNAAGGADEPAAEALENVETGLSIGQRAPDFTTETLSGETVSLADYRGQPVLLNFWATWCGPCRREMPDFEALYRARGDFHVLAVNNMEDAGRISEFVDDHDLTFPVLLDEAGTINGSVYGSRIPGYPTSFLLDENGIIVDYFPSVVSAAQLMEALDALEQG